MPQTSGPDSAIPASKSCQFGVSATTADTAPQPKAHMGGNQVTGFSSSSTAAALGWVGTDRVEAKLAMCVSLQLTVLIVNLA
jgi:hypothetical protein